MTRRQLLLGAAALAAGRGAAKPNVPLITSEDNGLIGLTASPAAVREIDKVLGGNFYSPSAKQTTDPSERQR